MKLFLFWIFQRGYLLTLSVVFIVVVFNAHGQPSIKSIEPLDVCVGETVTINGRKLKQVTHVVFNEVNLFLSSGDFLIVNNDRITFTAPLAAATTGRETVTTTIFVGSFGFYPADRQDNEMSVNRLPAEPENPEDSYFCQGDAISPVKVADPGSNYRIDWYNSLTGGTFLHTGTSYTPSGEGTYYAEVVNVSTGCTSQRVSVNAIQFQAPSPPSGARNSANCQGDPVNPVSVNNPGNGFRIDWYNASTGGTKLGSGISYTPAGPGTYYAETVNIGTSCSSLTRTSATVTLNPLPPPPANPINAFYCGTEPIPTIRVNNPGNGFTIKWYTQNTGSTLAEGTSSGQNGEIFRPANSVSATYFAGTENDQTACSSLTRTAVRIEKNPPGCSDTNITAFYFEEQDVPSEIDVINNKITATVEYGSALNKLVANYTIPQKAVAHVSGVIQQSGVTANNFTNPVTYVITAADGTTRQNWDVTVSVAPNRKAEILSFRFPEQTKPAVIDRNNRIITVEVVVWTDITRLIADFTISDGATAFVDNVVQESGLTVNNFSETITYKLIAQDGITSKNWQVRVVRQDIKDDEAPIIVSSVLPEEYPVIMDSILSNVVVKDNIGLSHVVLRYKRYQDSVWRQEVIRSQDSVFSRFIKEDLIDSHGMLYYFKAYDYKNNSDSTGIINMVKRYTDENSPEFPDLTFGPLVANYQMISVPLFLDDHSFEKIFDELMPYDIKRWRLFHYRDGLTGEYGKSFDLLIPGQSYWLIVRDQRKINVGAGVTNKIINGGYNMTLNPGWNQIGNPYSFDISWDDVILFNAGEPINRLKTYLNGVLYESETLPAFGGGFVFSGSQQSIQLKIPPVSGFRNARSADKGMIAGTGGPGTSTWFLPVIIDNGIYKNTLGGIGMNPESESGFDIHDEPLLPVPLEISGFEMYFLNEDEEYEKLSRDIVTTGNFYVWDFEVMNYGNSGNITLNWPIENWRDSEYQLVLLDESRSRLIEMNKTNTYTFSAGKRSKFKIYFGLEDKLSQEIRPGNIQIGEIYPNPFTEQIFIPLAIPGSNELYDVQVILMDLEGRKIQAAPVQQLTGGFHELGINIDSGQGNALNIIQIIISSATHTEVLYRKALKFR